MARAATRRLAAVLYATAAGMYLLDRVTKLWAQHALAGGPPITIIPGVVRLSFTTNSGGAFGLGGSAPWLFAAATIAVSAAIVVASARVTKPALAVAMGLVLGGALGNLTDRILRGPNLSGKVVDFIDFHIWPVFNLADSAIVIGAALILLAGIRHQEPG